MSKLDEVFGLPPMETKVGDVITSNGEVVVPETETLEENINYDYEQTRNNLHGLLAQGQEALIYALEVAKQSEHPRAFEVVGKLVEQLANVNHQLLELSEKKQKLSGKKVDEPEKGNVTNNAIFVGSTAELNNVLKSLNRGE